MSREGGKLWCLHLCLGLESGHVLCFCLKSNLTQTFILLLYSADIFIIYQGLVSQCQVISGNVNVGCS